MKTLATLSARTASGNGSAIALERGLTGLTFLLQVTEAADEAGDTLDVYLQDSIDGQNWDDLVHFITALGNGGAKTFLARQACLISPSSALGEKKDASLGAGVRQGPVGSQVRAKWVIAQSGDVPADGSFKFSVEMHESR
jgi:hypothetical protein